MLLFHIFNWLDVQVVTDRDETPKIEAEEENSSRQVLDEIDDLLDDLDNTPEVAGEAETPREEEEQSYQDFVADLQHEDQVEGKTDEDLDELSESKIDQMLELSLSEAANETADGAVSEDLLNARDDNEVQPGESENKPDPVRASTVNPLPDHPSFK